jgi:hypothetical protein
VVAGILDRHSVTRSKVRLEDPLDAVQRPTDHRDRTLGHTALPDSLGAPRGQLRQVGGLPVEPVRRIDMTESVAKAWEQRWVGISAGQVAHAGRNDRR